MLTIKRAVQIAILVMVITSGVLLGLSQSNIQLTLIAVIGGLTGFVVTDWKRWFQLRGLFANIASILVLIFAMKDFVGGDGASKLISVSNLLVYLQTVLMFQEKTPRLNWQLLVLSLLQIVVAAIFNLNFEGGLMFVFYFAVAGITLILQSNYASLGGIQKQNQNSSRELSHLIGSHDRSLRTNFTNRAARRGDFRPIAIADSASDRILGFRRILQHLSVWLVASLVFATVLFYIIPRGEQAWFGPSFVQSTATGMSKKVDLDERGNIEISVRLVMRAWFEKRIGEDQFVEYRPNGHVYFRGMALGNLEIVDDKTTWTAPYDRVFPAVYQALRKTDNWKNAVRQRVTLQPTNDPLIYAAMPVWGINTTRSEIEFCFELSSLTRKQGNERIETTPYTYELKTFVSPNGELLDSWPYMADLPPLMDAPMQPGNPGQYRWLTEIDRSRYPTIVQTADEIASRYPADRLRQIKAMESHFSVSNQFQYTLDFTNVNFRDDCDPIEDFFTNHHFGHCELYASALTIMLRSQGIPARLVVGFYASEFNEVSKCFMIRECHAHAWVEAYLGPEDCTPEMMANQAAGPGGAWLRLDPTPVSELNNIPSSGTAIESARTLWQDYVLGLDSSRQDEFAFESSSSRLLGLFDLSTWNQQFQDASDELERRPTLQAGILLLILLTVLFGLFKSLNRNKKNATVKQKVQRKGGLRRLLGDALSLISPELSKWMFGETSQEVSAEFYKRLAKILQNIGHVRQLSQTHREFANETIASLNQFEQNGLIRQTITDVTELFYQVRFGRVPLNESLRLQVMERLNQLEQHLGSVKALERR